MRFFALVCSITSTLLLAGCSQRAIDSADEPVAKTESPIVNGTPDVTHTAVIALLSNTSECSGTVVRVSGGNGYVLTAAHCCNPGNTPLHVIFANDYSQANAGNTYNVIQASVKQDPSWNKNTNAHDYCMLQFSGATAATPTMGVMTPATDNLAVGTMVDFVGYGLTGNPNNPANDNSVRRHKTGPLDQIQPLLVYYNTSNAGADPVNGGPCEGDSGGPAIPTAGPQVVAAVTSAGDTMCAQFGISGRVSGAYVSFIEPYLNNQPIMPAMDCATCESNATAAGGACNAAVQACLNDASCSALNTCLAACAANDQACDNACVAQDKAGLSKFNAIFGCECTQACPAECAADAGCMSLGCGLQSADMTCETCLTTSCCGPSQACASDAACLDCVSTANPAPSCASEPGFAAVTTCIKTSCSVQCSSGSSTSATSSATTTTAASTSASTGSGMTTTGSAMTTSGSGMGGSTGTNTGSGNAATGTTGVSAGNSGVGGDVPNASGGNSAVQTGGCSIAMSSNDRDQSGAIAGFLMAIGLVISRRRRSN